MAKSRLDGWTDIGISLTIFHVCVWLKRAPASPFDSLWVLSEHDRR